jgi:hypothetical protein
MLSSVGLDKHHYLDPIKRAVGNARWNEFESTPLGAKLRAVCLDLVAAQAELESRLTVGTPLRNLQQQLARLLAPSPVLTFGERPTHGLYPEEGREVEAVRYRLGLIGVGESIVDRIRAQLPASVLGRRALQEVQLRVSPGDTETEIEVIQVPFRYRSKGRGDSRLADACRDAGGTVRLAAGEGFSVSVSNLALR